MKDGKSRTSLKDEPHDIKCKTPKDLKKLYKVTYLAIHKNLKTFLRLKQTLSGRMFVVEPFVGDYRNTGIISRHSVFCCASITCLISPQGPLDSRYVK